MYTNIQISIYKEDGKMDKKKKSGKEKESKENSNKHACEFC